MGNNSQVANISSPQLDKIPLRIRRVEQWVCWKAVPKADGKIDKIPINPKTGAPAKSNDPATWSEFRQAAIYLQHHSELAGVGFVFTEGDPFCGIDLDDCRDPETGEISERAKVILDQFRTYSEVSPSKKGVKMFMEGKLPGKGVSDHKGGIEIYDRGRFFTATGDWIGDYPSTIENRSKELIEFYRTVSGDNGNQAAAGRNPIGWQDDVLKGVGAGGRHSTALRLAGRWAEKGHSDTEIIQFIAAWNQNNNPPKPELSDPTSKEIQDIIDYVRGKHDDLTTEPQPPQTTGDLFTDLENASRFAEKHRGKIRFCHKFNRHFVWNGKRWEMDASGGVYRLAREHVLSLLESARSIQDDKERAFFLKEMAKLQNERKLSSMLNLARHLDGIPVAPEDLDKDLMLFNCNDVTIDLKTFQYIPHDPNHLITKLAPFPIDGSADCPKWKEHLRFIMGGNQALIDFLQQAFGSCLSGDNRNRKLFLLWGSGANGKSVTLETIQTVLGDYAMKTPAETLLVKRFESIPNDLARLNGARFVYTSEVSDGKKMAEALVKEITGDKFITARFMRGEWFEFPVTFKIFLATNHLPTVRGTDPAIWDRIMLIPFNVRIPEDQRRAREDLIEEFRAEAPGILKWLLFGCHNWLTGGLNPPPEVLAANVTYREQSDYLKAFFDDSCILSEKAHAKSADLYTAYEKWGKENGEDTISKTAFGKKLREKGLVDYRDRAGLRAWKGIGLVQDSEAA